MLRLLLLCILILSISCSHIDVENKFNYDYTCKWIPFVWRSVKINNIMYDKAAIDLKMQFDGYPNIFKVQLDLGAPTTFISDNTLKSFSKLYKSLHDKIDTINYKDLTIEKYYKLLVMPSVSVLLDSIVFDNKIISIAVNYGKQIDIKNIQNEIIPLGVIGSDFFIKKILILDYRNERIAIIDTLNSKYESKFTFIKYKSFKNDNRIILPIKINNIDLFCMFDTGSSIFSAILRTDYWKLLSEHCESEMLKIMGLSQYIYTFQSKAIFSATINKSNFKPKYYYCAPQIDQFFKKNNIDGILGNEFFNNKIIIIDFKNKLFGIQK